MFPRFPRLLLPLWAAGMAMAAGVNEPIVVRSRSEQFVIHSPVLTTPLAAPGTNRNWIAVQPDPLAVSAERIKQRLLNELGAQDQWRGRIHLNIQPELPAGFHPVLTSAQFTDGWQYSVRLPTRLDREALVRGVLQAILTEIANRTPGIRPAELPAWLVHGLAAYFLNGRGPDVVFETNEVLNKVADGWSEVRQTVRVQASDRELSRLRDQLAQLLTPTILHRLGDAGIQDLRDYFDNQPPLAFNELSLPEPELLWGEDAPRFRASAQLFTLQLLSLPDGPRMMRELIANVTRAMNWQTAFLAAFSPVFSTPADVEKWWAVSSAGFSNRDESKTWSTAESLERLTLLLDTPVRVTKPGQPVPETVTLSLQRVVATLEVPTQLRILRDKLVQLRFLQGRASRESLALVSGYVDVLDRYVEQRPRAGAGVAVKGEREVNLRILTRTTQSRLDTLDQRRASAVAKLSDPPETAPGTP